MNSNQHSNLKSKTSHLSLQSTRNLVLKFNLPPCGHRRKHPEDYTVSYFQSDFEKVTTQEENSSKKRWRIKTARPDLFLMVSFKHQALLWNFLTASKDNFTTDCRRKSNTLLQIPHSSFGLFKSEICKTEANIKKTAPVELHQGSESKVQVRQRSLGSMQLYD